MAILQIRDLPEDLYAALRREAERSHRSIAQQAIVELRKDAADLRQETRSAGAATRYRCRG